VDKNWLNELCRAFQEYPQASSCGGRQELPSDAAGFEKRVFSFMQKCAFFADYSRPAKKETIFEVEHNPSCCVMYKRDAFIKAGGFLEGLWPGEDVELDYRLKKAGAKIIFNPGAIVYHYRPGDLDSFLKMMSRYGWAQGALVRKYGFFRPIQYLPLIGLLFIILIFVCLFFLVQFFTSILALIFFLGLIYFKFNIMLLTMAVLAFFSWNLGFFKGLARRL
jgi:GT2 family glycosyltransferase